MAAPGTVHLEHAEVLRDSQGELILFHPAFPESSYSPCYSEQHEESNLGQNTLCIHAVASYHQPQFLVPLRSAQEETTSSIMTRIDK